MTRHQLYFDEIEQDAYILDKDHKKWYMPHQIPLTNPEESQKIYDEVLNEAITRVRKA